MMARMWKTTPSGSVTVLYSFMPLPGPIARTA